MVIALKRFYSLPSQCRGKLSLIGALFCILYVKDGVLKITFIGKLTLLFGIINLNDRHWLGFKLRVN